MLVQVVEEDRQVEEEHEELHGRSSAAYHDVDDGWQVDFLEREESFRRRGNHDVESTVVEAASWVESRGGGTLRRERGRGLS